MIKGLLAALCMAAPFAMSADDVEIDGIKYSIYSTETTCKAIGLAEGSTIENLVIPAEVTYNNKTYKVSVIQDFAGCSTLTSVTVPGTVTRVGNSSSQLAFNNCNSLKELILEPADKSLEPAKENLSLNYIGEGITTIKSGRKFYISSFSSGLNKSLERVAFFGDYIKTISGTCYDCKKLQEVTIPASVTEMKVQAFESCSISSFVIEAGEETLAIDTDAFKSTHITNFKLDRSITISAYAVFQSMTGITNLIIGPNAKEYSFMQANVLDLEFEEGVTEVYTGAFTLSKLYSVKMNEGLTTIQKSAFSNCTSLKIVEFPESMTLIGEGALQQATNLESVVLPSSLETIGKSAFYGCSKLASVKLPANLVTLEGYAFQDCKALANIELPSSLKTIGGSAFGGCTNIKEISIPESVTQLSSDCFSGCVLTSFRIEEGEDPLEYSGFGNSPAPFAGAKVYVGRSFSDAGQIPDFSKVLSAEIGKYADNYSFSGNTTLTTVVIEEGSTIVPKNAFYNCTKLSSLSLPSTLITIGEAAFQSTTLTSYPLSASITSIGKNAFNGCSNMANIELPESLESIGAMAFNNCSKLKTLTIPASVKTIGSSAFQKCSDLREVTALPVAPPELGLNAFYGLYSQVTLYVKNNSLEAYRSANEWSNFYKIVGMDSALDEVEAADAVEAVYYDLRGVRVANPVNGVFVKVAGNKAVKVAL